MNYHYIHRIGFYLHHSITESIYFCCSLSYFGLCNNCNSSLTCWTARIHYSVPITNKISSIPSSYLTDTHNTQPIFPHFLFNILQFVCLAHPGHHYANRDPGPPPWHSAMGAPHGTLSWPRPQGHSIGQW